MESPVSDSGLFMSRGRPHFSKLLVSNSIEASAMASSTVELNEICTCVQELEVVVDGLDSKENKNAM